MDEYSSVRGQAERGHAFRVLDALLHTVRGGMTPKAIRALPVGAVLLCHGRVALINAAAQRMLAEHGLPAPLEGDAVADIDAAVSALLTKAVAAPKRQRTGQRLGNGQRIDFLVDELDDGTLVFFAPAPHIAAPPP